MSAAAALFSEQGYSGTSVREICQLADVSSNMIHHYFGNKQKLYDEVLAGFTDDVWVVPLRIIAQAPRSVDDLRLRLEIFVGETMEALIKHRLVYEMIVRERLILDVFVTYTSKLLAFLKLAQQMGFTRKSIDLDMITGLILDRVGNQILYASWIEDTSGFNVLTDVDYRSRWVRANLDVFLGGILAD